MQTNNRKNQRKGVGRKPKLDPAIHRYGVRLTSEENGHFDIQFQKSGFKERSKFLKALIFEREVGNNYNQTVRAVKANFGDQRAFALVAKLEKATLELVVLSKQIIALTREFEERHLNRKSGG